MILLKGIDNDRSLPTLIHINYNKLDATIPLATGN